jgi:hypothetical protein
MKATVYKKGDRVKSFSQQVVWRAEEHHLRGTKDECKRYITDHKLKGASLHKVTGDKAPYDEWYGVAY